MDKTIIEIRKQLTNAIDPDRKNNAQYFFKEEINAYGISNSVVHLIAKEFIGLLKEKTKEDIFVLCEELFKSGNLEESLIACDISYSRRKFYEESDFPLFEKWIGLYVNNWATCDTFCNHNVGYFLEKYPQYISTLKIWTKSENRWLRRASAVSLIIPAKRGKFLNDILEIANLLLYDKEDLVQKGNGWMLKVTSLPHQMEIFNYIMANKATMPRTTLRYAIEKLPVELKSKAMEK